MRIVLQRVSRARVRVDRSGAEAGGGSPDTVGAIGKGCLLLVAIEAGDTEDDVMAAAEKLARLRVFEDAAGKMNLDATQAGAAFLVVSQFTLAADLRKGRRPSFHRSAPPVEAAALVEALARALEAHEFEVAQGEFGAQMEVELTNDGPVTFVLDVRGGRGVDDRP